MTYTSRPETVLTCRWENMQQLDFTPELIAQMRVELRQWVDSTGRVAVCAATLDRMLTVIEELQKNAQSV